MARPSRRRLAVYWLSTHKAAFGIPLGLLFILAFGALLYVDTRKPHERVVGTVVGFAVN